MRKFGPAVSSLCLALATTSLAGGASLPAHAATVTPFTLDATVLDGGQQVTSITLATAARHIDARSLSVDTFQVHAAGRNPYQQLDPATVVGTYDQYRTITGVHLDRRGNVVIQLLSGPDAPAASTFAWAGAIGTGVVGRNVRLDLAYTVTQRRPLRASGRPLTLGTFRQGSLVDHELSRYRAGRSSSGLDYRLFTPPGARAGNKRPLVVWLHGGGEGAWSGAHDTTMPLVANRGALGFSTAAAQRTFGGAFVVAPQATDYWMNDKAMGYTAKLKKLVDQLAARYPINTRRIYVVGASNGGYQTLSLASTYPRTFAAAVPVCPGVVFGKQRLVSDAQFRAMRSTPTWIVQAKNDPVLPFATNGLYAWRQIGNAHLSAYPDVVREGHTYPGHWSWIHVARNDPRLDNGTRLFTWMARQHR